MAQVSRVLGVCPRNGQRPKIQLGQGSPLSKLNCLSKNVLNRQRGTTDD
mgnify:CR=1 FL=1